MAVDPFGALARMKRPMRESPERASFGSFGSFDSPGSFGLSDATEPGPYRREAARTPAPAWWTAYPARKAAADSTGRVLAAFHAALPCGAGVDRVALARSRARPGRRRAPHAPAARRRLHRPSEPPGDPDRARAAAPTSR
ncbi:hypothetical protein [Burkholderia pseudomallei]|uniref:hypothetical protein n=1 Tax=Burkholderia pseudomallei TaxID=28450 RepID=UPI0005310637|nr:hypothetical protein [Burkholderia pseudomallei]KGS67637.1 hypothetical protein X990_3673 [Burkholderia pseudomallei MSHR4868]